MPEHQLSRPDDEFRIRIYPGPTFHGYLFGWHDGHVTGSSYADVLIKLSAPSPRQPFGRLTGAVLSRAERILDRWHGGPPGVQVLGTKRSDGSGDRWTVSVLGARTSGGTLPGSYPAVGPLLQELAKQFPHSPPAAPITRTLPPSRGNWRSPGR